MKKQQGYTLAEVLIVVVIIAIMASLIIPRLLTQSTKAAAAEAINMIGAIKRGETQYFDTQGDYLSVTNACSLSPDDLGIDFSDVCVGTPSAAKKWQYSVTKDSGSGVWSITATSVTTASDTLYYRLSGTDRGKWGGSGTFDCDDGANWPNLKDKLSSCA